MGLDRAAERMTADTQPDAGAHTDPRVLRSRAKIIAATLQLLSERGIAGTTIEAVAARSGVAKTTIYRHWEDQPTLVIAAITSTLHEPLDPDTGTLREDLHILMGGLARALAISRAASLMPALIDAAEREPAFALLHQKEAAHRHRAVRAVIERGVSRGELPAATDPDEVLDLLTGPLFYRRWVSRVAVDATFPTRVVDVVLAGYESAPQEHAVSGPR